MLRKIHSWLGCTEETNRKNYLSLVKQVAGGYFKACLGFTVYGYRHNLWELRKKRREGVLRPTAAAQSVSHPIFTQF